MKNLKKIDEFDFVFINKSLSEKEDREFSDFLKKRRLKLKQTKILQTSTRTKKVLV
jgi:hypothetical protein